ncbi:MAG: hypothetical protein EZS28_019461, partial [Streblomastix strix]
FEFDFDPATTEDRDIQLELWDYDTIGDNDQIGQLKIPIDDISKEKELKQYTFIGIGNLYGQNVGVLDIEQQYEGQGQQSVEEEEQEQEEQPAEEEQEQEEQPAAQEEEQPVENKELTKGKLTLNIIGVKDVTAMDSNGKSDPFIVVKFAGQEKKTKKVKDTLNAEYNETFEFDFDPATTEDRDIQLELWDYDTIGDNDQIGQLKIPITKVGTKENKSYTFVGVNNLYGKDVGILDIEHQFQKEGGDEQEEEQKQYHDTDDQFGYESALREGGQDKQNLTSKRGLNEEKGEQGGAEESGGFNASEKEPVSAGKIVLTIIGVKDVTAMDSNGKSDPYFIVKFAGEEKKTNKVKNTLNAEYNETFEFDFDPDKTEDREVILELWDYDTFGDNDQIGQYRLQLSEIPSQAQKKTYVVNGVEKLYGQEVGYVDVEQSYERYSQEEVQKRKLKRREYQIAEEGEDEQAKNREFNEDQNAGDDEGTQTENKFDQDGNVLGGGDVVFTREKKFQTADKDADEVNDEELTAGKVTLTIIGVKDVTAMDSNGKSDPFIVVKFAGQEKKTKKVKNTLNAEYNETFEFDFDPTTTEDRDIQLELWDYDTIGDNDQIGQLKIPLGQISRSGEIRSYTFTGVNKLYGQDVGIVDIGHQYERPEIEDEGKEEGDEEEQNQIKSKEFNDEEREKNSPVDIGVQTEQREADEVKDGKFRQYKTQTDEEEEEEEEEEEQPVEQEGDKRKKNQSDGAKPGRIEVNIIGVKDVTAMDSNGKSDPFIVVKFAGQEKKTKKVKDTLNAEYNEKFEFLFDPETTEEREIQLELWDYDTIGDDDQIGQYQLPFLEYADKKQKKTVNFKGVQKLYGQEVGVLDLEVLYDVNNKLKDKQQVLTPEEERKKIEEELQKVKKQKELEKKKQDELEKKKKEELEKKKFAELEEKKFQELERKEREKQQAQKNAISEKERDLYTDRNADLGSPSQQQKIPNASGADKKQNQSRDQDKQDDWNETPAQRTKKTNGEPGSYNYYITVQSGGNKSRDRGKGYDDDAQYPVSQKEAASSRQYQRPEMKRYIDKIYNEDGNNNQKNRKTGQQYDYDGQGDEYDMQNEKGRRQPSKQKDQNKPSKNKKRDEDDYRQDSKESSTRGNRQAQSRSKGGEVYNDYYQIYESEFGPYKVPVTPLREKQFLEKMRRIREEEQLGSKQRKSTSKSRRAPQSDRDYEAEAEDESKQERKKKKQQSRERPRKVKQDEYDEPRYARDEPKYTRDDTSYDQERPKKGTRDSYPDEEQSKPSTKRQTRNREYINSGYYEDDQKDRIVLPKLGGTDPYIVTSSSSQRRLASQERSRQVDEEEPVTVHVDIGKKTFTLVMDPKNRPTSNTNDDGIKVKEAWQSSTETPRPEDQDVYDQNSPGMADIEKRIPLIVRDVYPPGISKIDGEKKLTPIDDVIQEISGYSGGDKIKVKKSNELTQQKCQKQGDGYIEPNTEAHKQFYIYFTQATRKLNALQNVLSVPNGQKEQFKTLVPNPQSVSDVTLFNYKLIYDKVESYLPAYELKKTLARNLATRNYIVDNFFSLNDAGTAFKLLTSLVSKIKHYTDLCKQGLRQWLN